MIPNFARRRTLAVDPNDTGVRFVSTSNGGSQTNTVTVAAPANIVAGNFLYAFACWDDVTAGNNLTSPGWTVDQAVNFTTHNDNDWICGIYKVATASEPSSYTFSVSSQGQAMSVVIVQLSGVNTATPFNTASKTNKTASTNTTAPFAAMTTTKKAAVLLGAAQGGNYSGTVGNVATWSSPYTQIGLDTSQYNQGSNFHDSEAVSVALSQSVVAGTFTPASVVWNKAYYNGTLTVALNGIYS